MSGVKWNQPELMARVRRGAMQGVTDWIGLVEERAVQLIMNPPKSGIVYRKRGVSHQASAPGEAPASETGRLVNSRRISLNEAQLRASLNFSTQYAIMLERGTRKMEPRPYAARSLSETFSAGIQCVERRIAENLR